VGGLRDTDPDEVRRVFAVCGQDTDVFDMTARENLSVARPGP
jgi:ABC-type transport system involved in cytochrome bd biosynthesis fused ATPase/permease subunit